MRAVKALHHTIVDMPWNLSVSIAHAVHAQQNDYSYINSVIQAFENEGIKTDRFQKYKLWSLVKLLEKYKPKSILELGSGSSTTVFSDYADKYGACITSLETDKGWADLVRRHIGNNVNIVECNASGDATSTPKFLRFDTDLEGQQFDLVLIDVPGDKIPGIAKKEGVTMNVLEMSPLPNMVLIDGRKATVTHMKNHPLMSGHNFTSNDLYTNKVLLSGYNFFSIFHKK